MTPYEIARSIAWPFLPALQHQVNQLLQERLVEMKPEVGRLLDVGGRSSPYTVGLKAAITILDLPRTTEVQAELGLGLDTDTQSQIPKRRSNIKEVIVEDFLETSLPPRHFDGVVAVEVLEHVEQDEMFLRRASRVLKPDGWFIMTTPNGDYIKNQGSDFNPDHCRHYTRHELQTLLDRVFTEVDVCYAVKTGRHRYRGLRSMSPFQPLRMLVSMLGNCASHFESRGLENTPSRTAHLIATARKAHT